MVSVPFPNNGQNKNFKKDFNSENTGLVPPQNVQPEEAVLGGILLDPDAIGRIADLIKPDAFYINAHQEIYRTALMLHTQGKPTDLTSMSAWLADNGSLEKIAADKLKQGALDFQTALSTIGRFTIKKQVGEDGVLFGTVTNGDVAEVIEAATKKKLIEETSQFLIFII